MMSGSKIENVHISEAIAIKLHIKASFKPCSHLPDNDNFDPLKLAFVKPVVVCSSFLSSCTNEYINNRVSKFKMPSNIMCIMS